MLRRFFSFIRGIFALFFRSLRIDARSIRIHSMWLLFLLVIYGALWVARETASTLGAPGLHFFRNVMYLDAAFITVLGITFFSSSISEEKEEDTLGLMTMAGIGPLGVLLGKSTSRLFQVVLLLAIQYPFTLLAVTLGGLLPTQVISAYLSLVAYTILVANAGLFCSVICQTNRSASGMTFLCVIAYLLLPLFAYGGAVYLKDESHWTKTDILQTGILNCLEAIADSPFYFELYSVTETGYKFRWSVQMIGNATGGVLLFFLSWMTFGFVAKEPLTDAVSRGLVAQATGHRNQFFGAGRVWNRPLMWKEFSFITGGWAGLVGRALLLVGLWVMCWAANYPWYANSGIEPRWQDVTYGFQAFAHPLIALDVALCVGRVFQEEIKGQTLSLLLMLPRSTFSVVYGKLAGCALGAIPGIVALFLSLLLPGGTDFLVSLRSAPWGYLWWFVNLGFAIHLTMLFSLLLRSGALVLAITVMISTMILVNIFVITPNIAKAAETQIGACTLGIALTCVVCHLLTLRIVKSYSKK